MKFLSRKQKIINFFFNKSKEDTFHFLQANVNDLQSIEEQK